MIVKRCIRTILTGLLLAALLPVGVAMAQTLKLKLGHFTNEQNSWHQASLKFAEEVAARTQGRIVVEVYPNDSLGREMDLLNGMQLGTVEMTITGESLANWAPKAVLVGLPYAYTSLAHVDAVANGEIGDQIKAEIIERAQVRPLAYFARGPRNLTSKRPITHPDEIKGLKIRVANVPLHVSLWSALGAQPTPMAFSEVFTSLQNGTIKAQENPLAQIQSGSFNEVQSYVNETEHARSWIYLAIAEQVWSRLSREDQGHLLEAARVAQAFERELFLRDEAAIRADLQAKGMTFVKADQEAFAKRARDAVIQNVDPGVRPIAEALFNR